MRLRSKNIALAVVATLAAAAPALSASAVDNQDTTINATVNSVLAMTATTASVALTLTPTSGPVQSTNSGTTTVNTNNSTGYTLKIKDKDVTTSLASGANNIVKGTGTAAAPVALSNGQWGWAIAGAPFDATYTVANNVAATGAKYAGILTTDANVKVTSGVATNDVTTLYYSALVTTTQPTGVYTSTVTLTATANP